MKIEEQVAIMIMNIETNPSNFQLNSLSVLDQTFLEVAFQEYFPSVWRHPQEFRARPEMMQTESLELGLLLNYQNTCLMN